MSEKKDIGNVLKSAMDGYQAAPDDLWPGLESSLKRRKRIAMLWWALLLLSVLIIGAALIYNINSDNSSSDQLDKIDQNPTTEKESDKNINKKDSTKEITSTDSISNQIQEQQLNSTAKIDLQKSKTKVSYASRKKGQKHGKENPDENKMESFQKSQGTYHSFLEMLEAKKLSNLQLIIDSIQISETPSLKEEEKVESIWRFSPFVSIDHYNAFGRSTSQQNTLNYGAYLYFYGSENLALRIGFKKVDLQYNFLDRNDPSQQQVSYNEIPMEGRYFFGTEKKLKTSFIVGGSFLFVQNATLIDFDNNIIEDNRDLFTDASFSLNTGLGLHYDFSPKWRVNLESAIKYYVAPFARNQSYSPYNLSLSFGIEYGF